MKTLSLLTIVSITAIQPALAADNIYVRPKALTAGQFSSNCNMQGGTAVDISGPRDTSATIDCQKKNGTSVTCSFDAQDGTLCVGESRTPRRPS